LKKRIFATQEQSTLSILGMLKVSELVVITREVVVTLQVVDCSVWLYIKHYAVVGIVRYISTFMTIFVKKPAVFPKFWAIFYKIIF
jgi:hypothetical protein